MDETQARIDWIRTKLTNTLNPINLEIIDDSHEHAGHKGNMGGGHFTVKITSNDFNGQNTIKRHQLVFAALKEEMTPGKAIHALNIIAKTPNEIQHD